jgi:hypothetical protein
MYITNSVCLYVCMYVCMYVCIYIYQVECRRTGPTASFPSLQLDEPGLYRVWAERCLNKYMYICIYIYIYTYMLEGLYRVRAER